METSLERIVQKKFSKDAGSSASAVSSVHYHPLVWSKSSWYLSTSSTRPMIEPTPIQKSSEVSA